MNQICKAEIYVHPEIAAALVDKRRLEAVGQLADRLVRPGTDDPLLACLEQQRLRRTKLA